MLSKEEYRKNLIRTFDSVRVNNKGEENCAGVTCYDCPFFEKICNMGGIIRRLPPECVENIGRFVIHPYETIKIVENWVKEHSVMTNTMKFEEIFGIQPSEISSCDDFWNKEYAEKKQKVDQQIDTGSKQECHEMHKRYGKGMAKEVKGFSSAYPSICDLKIVLNIDGTWLTIHDNLDTVVTIKLSDLNDIIHGEVANNEESEDKK